MYRQPENYNKVKSMRNHFEELNLINTVNEKNKQPSVKVSDTNLPNFKKNITSNEPSEKFKQKFETNSSVKHNFDRKNSVKENQNLKIQSVASQSNANNRINERILENVLQEDFTNINKSKPCSVSSLNLTKQLNDPLKKGCIKRTPAFRKEKSSSNRLKSNEDLNFANIVKLFENIDEKYGMCDYIDKSNNKTVSLAAKNKNCDTCITNFDSKQKLTTVLDKEDSEPITVFKDQDVVHKIDNLTLCMSNEDTMSHKRQNSVSLVKEIVQNLSVREIETLQTSRSREKDLETIPEYAKIIKSKKNTTDKYQCGNELSDTLKAALKQPLPSGPPPKKPPRTFAHTSSTKLSNPDNTLTKSSDDTQSNCNVNINSEFCEKLSETLALGLVTKSPEMPKKLTKIKSDPKLMLQKLENALLSNKIRSPKLPRKIKCSVEKSNKSSVSTNSVMHQNDLEANIYVTDTTQKHLFPNCLPSLNCVSKSSSSMNNYAQILPVRNSSSEMNAACTKLKRKFEEPVYAEPFHFSAAEKSTAPVLPYRTVSINTDTVSNSLHYMSNQVCEEPWNESQPNVNVLETTNCDTVKKIAKNSESELLSRKKLHSVMDNVYVLSTSSESDSDSVSSASEDLPLKKRTIKDLIWNFEQKQPEQNLSNIRPKNEEKVQVVKASKSNLSRIQTERRKKYVRRVCSSLNRRSETDIECLHLFECCLLVGLNVSTLTPYIKNRYPANFEVPPWVEHLCFPDATEWLAKSSSVNISQDCQCYTLVITNEKGDRKFGYCRRVLPEEASVCLPIAYCIISSFRATGFYHKVLQELESRHGLPFWLQDAFVKELYNSKFPKPGESIKVSCLLKSLVVNSCEEMIKNQQIQSPENIACVQRILNTRKAAHETLEKITEDKDNTNKNSVSDGTDWIIVDENKFKCSIEEIPKIIYENFDDINTENFSQNAFDKINKYSKDSRRCVSIQNESDCANLDILRVKTSSTSFIFRNQEKYNVRCSEPQINKRIGQIFTDLNVKEDVKSLECNVDDEHSDISESCSSPLLNLPNSQLMHDCLLGDVVLRRPYDSRLEDIDLTTLFDTLNMSTLLKTFGSLLHERKVIFVSSCLSKLSSCIEALQSILYPFSWQHTFIPVLHYNMLDILNAPLPLITGVLASHLTEKLNVEEGIAVDLDTSVVLCSVGDESHIIPKRLRAALRTSLQLVSDVTNPEDRSRNVLVSDSFIRMFVEICGCYQQFIHLNEHDQNIFEKELFVKHHKFKCMNLFLEWFAETAMFSAFIQPRLNGRITETIFEQRCLDLNCEKNVMGSKESKVTQKMKNFGNKLKQLSTFH